METKAKSKEREFYNVRVRADLFKTISEWAFHENVNVARCIEDALESYIEDRDLEVVR